MMSYTNRRSFSRTCDLQDCTATRVFKFLPSSRSSSFLSNTTFPFPPSPVSLQAALTLRNFQLVRTDCSATHAAKNVPASPAPGGKYVSASPSPGQKKNE